MVGATQRNLGVIPRGLQSQLRRFFFLSSKTRAQQSSETRLPGGESSGSLAGVGEGAPQNESLYDVKRFHCESMIEKPCKGEKKKQKPPGAVVP